MKKKKTYGKNLKAFTSKLFLVNASRMSSSVTVVLQEMGGKDLLLLLKYLKSIFICKLSPINEPGMAILN